jgi:hypothetical protein
MVCGMPSSKTSKSDCASVVTGRPFLSTTRDVDHDSFRAGAEASGLVGFRLRGRVPLQRQHSHGCKQERGRTSAHECPEYDTCGAELQFCSSATSLPSMSLTCQRR